MKVLLAADSDGFALKEELKQYLVSENFEVCDKSETAAKDFVDATLAVAQAIQADNNNEKFGIVIDAYGVGSFMVATKLKGIVAAEVSDERSAYMTREHNNARIITMGSLIVGTGLAKRIAQEFLSSNYAGGRHQIRVDMLNKMA